MALNFSWVEDHKLWIGGGALVGGILLYLYWRSGSSASSASNTSAGTSGASSTGIDPTTASYDLASQSAAYQYQVGVLTTNNDTGVSLADIAATQETTDRQTDSSTVLGLTGFADSLAGLLNTNSASQQVANAQTQAQVQLAEIQAGRGLTYTTAAGGPFSDLYSGGIVPTNNPSSTPANVAVVGSNGQVANGNDTLFSPNYSAPLGYGQPTNGVNWNPITNQANLKADTGSTSVYAASPAAFGATLVTVPINANNPGEGTTQALVF